MNQVNINEISKRFLKSQSADIYDVLDQMGFPNQCMDINIAPLRDDMKVCGPAFTVWGMRESRYDENLQRPDFDNYAMFNKMYQGCVVVMNSEKDDVVGHWGEMMSYGARNCGAVGAVIDGGTRDKMSILNIKNWACFARYTSPVESKKRWRPKELQVPIIVTGTLTKHLTVNPGDWIFGDVDGIIVIPKEICIEVLNNVEDLSNREELSREDLAKGEKLQDVFLKYRRA
jgi:4-hydroxy-4-methyl-2-oxoglutarate aldolase